MGCSIGELLVTQRADLLRACQERLLYLDFYARLSYAEVFGSFTFLWQKRKILQTRKCSCTTLALDAMTGQYILWCYHFICQIVILVLQKLLPWLMKLCIQKIKELSENSLHAEFQRIWDFLQDPKDVPCIPLTFKRIQRRKHAIFISWIFCIFCQSVQNKATLLLLHKSSATFSAVVVPLDILAISVVHHKKRRRESDTEKIHSVLGVIRSLVIHEMGQQGRHFFVQPSSALQVSSL